jgi:hypothetical protein
MSDKIQCKMCLFENNGFCSKKRNGGKQVKVDLGKKRFCDLYVVDPIKNTEQLTRSLMAKTRALRVAKNREQMELFLKQQAKTEQDKEIVE